MTIPEFYKKSVLSGDLNNMPQDAPFRYQGANPTKCYTKYSADDGVTDLVLEKGDKLGPSSASRLARLDKVLRTYAMAIARKYYLKKRINFLNKELVDALDWIDTQGDEYGYDQTMTAVEDDD
jgi:endonuclease/exonuclease/phosphatase family metal-dependent hydrolase